MDAKEAPRRRIWNLLEEQKVTRFPKPVAGGGRNFGGRSHPWETLPKSLK